MAYYFLQLKIMIDRKVWHNDHPLCQFKRTLNPTVRSKLNHSRRKLTSVETLVEADAREVGALLNVHNGGRMIIR